MKKIAAFLSVAGLMAVLAVPAMAEYKCRCYPHRPCRCRDKEITVVENGADAYADTGANQQDNTALVTRSCGVDVSTWTSGLRDMSTGDAEADAFSSVDIDSQPPCGGPICGISVMGGGPRLGRPRTTVRTVANYSQATAMTGGNSQNNTAVVNHVAWSSVTAGGAGGRDMDTGDATARSTSWVVIGADMD